MKSIRLILIESKTEPDMSAFKAANPDAIFEDFIRWHSPKDWEDEDTLDGGDVNDQSETKWPPRGRLSARMSDNANSWRKIWNEAPALSVSNQKPLLDPNREGEKARLYIPCCLVTNCPRTLRRQEKLIGSFILYSTLPLTSMSGQSDNNKHKQTNKQTNKYI